MTATGHHVRTYPFGKPEGLDLDPNYARLRAEGLARVEMPYGGEAWLATRYEDVKTVLADPRFSRAETHGKDIPRIMPGIQYDPSILSMDPPEHSRLRKLVAKAFTARHVERLRPRVQAIIDELLDGMIATGSPANLAESLSWPLPIVVICELLGVPVEDRDRFRVWTDLVLALGGVEMSEIEDASKNIQGYLAELIAKRRVEPTEDLLGQLVAARDDDDRLSEQELIVFGVTLLIAGHETTANQTGNFVYLLLNQPELWQRLVADPDLVPSAIEELSRFTPLGAAGDFARIATEDLELGGQLVRKGDAVIVQFAAANRDASVFERPDEIDLDREHNPHIAFGHGVHHCLGAPLARLELQLVIGTLVRRLPELRLAVPAGDVTWRADRLVRGVQALPVAW
ncbi:MAG TPA: cytochrome P450 [Pseudonocardiaceae bacterium]|jgi:cytochrome P450 RapN|nr:cytochrome P450 [Pseudonocardiaceae bacterium]